MSTKIGSAPTTDPQWIDNKLMNNEGLTAKEQKIADRQTEVMTTSQGILNQTVHKGDWEKARKQEKELKEQFQSLSKEDKQFMYNVLQSGKGMAGLFQYRLATASRERLLKVLNPDHVTPQKLQGKVANEAKAAKSTELDMEGMSRANQLREKVIQNLRN